jgi:hypothetical protein
MAGAADQFVLDALSRGPVPASDVIEAGKAAGLSARQIRRGRERLGVTCTQAGSTEHGRHWLWSLPGVQVPPTATEAAPAMTASTMDLGPSMDLMDNGIDDRPINDATDDWQAPPVERAQAMERDQPMERDRPRSKPKGQVPPLAGADEHDECSKCGRMTCGVCGSEVPAHRARAHREGRDSAWPQCPAQSVVRERPRSWSEQLFGVISS